MFLAHKLVPVLFLASACSGGVDLDDTGGASTLPEGCSGAGPIDTYVQGLEKTTGSGTTVSFLDADPAPPDVGLNTFTVQVDAPAGSAVRVRPWMPLHGHGVPGEWVDTTESGGGYTVTDLDLFMPGAWEMFFTIDSTDKDGDGALFRFCLEG